MVRAGTVGIVVGIFGMGALGAVLMSKLATGAPAAATPTGKLNIIHSGSRDVVTDFATYRGHQFQFWNADGTSRIGNEDFEISVTGIYSGKDINIYLEYKDGDGNVKRVGTTGKYTYRTPPADQMNELTIIPRTSDEGVNIKITRKATGEKFWFQCIYGCGKISGG